MDNEIKERILEMGADVCGVADIDRFTDFPKGFSPLDVFSECKSVITFGIALPKGLTTVDSNLIYGHFNDLLCPRVDAIALDASKMLEYEYDCRAVPLPCDTPYDYWDEEKSEGKGIISMKHAAVACGLGTIGKNTLLINPDYGNLLTIGALLTDLELESDPLCEEMCIKGCAKCIESCPAEAIHGGMVNQKLCRENTYGKNKRGFSTVNCNKCRTACPMRFGRNEEE